jgi:hypothetical protein
MSSRAALLRRIEALESQPSFQRPIVITGGLPKDVCDRMWAEHLKAKAPAPESKDPAP